MAKNLELVKFGVDFIKAWQIWFFGARVCGLYFFWCVAKSVAGVQGGFGLCAR